jgi:hypothetical protein
MVKIPQDRNPRSNFTDMVRRKSWAIVLFMSDFFSSGVRLYLQNLLVAFAFFSFSSVIVISR